MQEVVFLLVLGLVWIIFASIQDISQREVADWLSFSLILFAIGFRFFYSLFSMNDFDFFYQGLIGLGIFFILGNLFYYGRMFAGGDAKLMIALGAVLPFSEIFSKNLEVFLWFFAIFLVTAFIYSFAWSAFLMINNFGGFKKQFLLLINNHKKKIYFVMIFGLVIMALGFYQALLFILGLMIFILPVFYLYAKSIDEACMIKKVSTAKLTEGDWLYNDVKVGSKTIKAKWEGLSINEIKSIKRKHKTILIRQGIPFIPVFLITYVFLIYIWFFR